jgi:hypothetical protein
MQRLLLLLLIWLLAQSQAILHDFAPVTNGASLACFFNSGNRRNGLALGIMGCKFSQLNGLGFGIVLLSKHINGLAIGPFGVGSSFIGSDSVRCSRINGIAFSYIRTEADTVNGISIGGLNKSITHCGIAVGITNRSQHLRGLQLGLLNYAANNPRWLRWLPGANFHI